MDELRYRQAEAALWASVDAAPTEQFIDLARTGARVRVQELGDGPPVLFVHGASNAGTSWAALASRLPDHRCLLLDRPGCGLSPRLPTGMADIGRLAEFADALIVDVLDALDLPHAAVVGTSFGGYFVLRAAAAHPDRIARLVSLGWSLGAPAETAPLYMRIATHPSLGRLAVRIPPNERMARSLLRQIGLRGAIDSGRFGPVEMSWFLSLLRDTATMRNEIDAGPRLMTLRGFDVSTVLPAEVLGRVSTPSLFLWGGADPMGSETIARPFVAQIPGATLEMLPGSGHAPWIDDPDGVAARVRAFLGED